MIGIAAMAVLALGAWGPLPSTSAFRAPILRARLALGVSCPGDSYQIAELLYELGDFEKALLQCEKALQVNPRHAPALALQMELQFILGRGIATSPSTNYDVCMHRSFIPTAQLLIEIERALQRADEHGAAGDSQAGMAEVRKALEFLKWMAEGEDLNSRRNRAEFLKILLATDGSTDD